MLHECHILLRKCASARQPLDHLFASALVRDVAGAIISRAHRLAARMAIALSVEVRRLHWTGHARSPTPVIGSRPPACLPRARIYL